MQTKQHLNDAELSELLGGERMEEATRHLAGCTTCAAELVELANVRDALRSDLNAACDRPAHFWMRQQAQLRERLAVHRTPLRWPIAAMAALAALSFGLFSIKAPAPTPARSTQSADADDLLLRDIQHSLAQRAPEPLLPATVLVQEMTTNPRNDGEREN